MLKINFFMAVPKKRQSKSKTNIRKNQWRKKVIPQAMRALFLAKYTQKMAILEESEKALKETESAKTKEKETE